MANQYEDKLSLSKIGVVPEPVYVEATDESDGPEVPEEPPTSGGSSTSEPSEPEHDAEGKLGDSEEVTGDQPPKTPGKFKRFFMGYWRKKKWTLPLTAVVLVGIIFALPLTRYPLLALGLKQTYTVEVFDSKTNTPVSGAKVTLDGQTATTSSTGFATLKVKVGKRSVSVSKQYYQSATKAIFVGVSATKNSSNVQLNATGRQVPIIVVNKITGKPVSNAEIRVLDTEAKTDASGKATIVLPTSSTSQAATVNASGYNSLASTVTVTSSVVSSNTFALTPSGRVYFLSNLNGNIDVVSTNLDGTGRNTVLAGTGNEDPNNTSLLASRDWQYLALYSKRDSGQNEKLYLINASNDQLTTIDGNGSSDNIQLIGWVNHSFVYRLTDNNIQSWQNGQTMLKSYNADTGKTVTIDQTSADGIQGNFEDQSFTFTNLINDKVVYGMAWGGFNTVVNTAQHDSIMSADADGSNKVTLKSISIPNSTYNTYLGSVVAEPGSLEIQAQVGNNPTSIYYSYNYGNNTVSQSNTISDASFGQTEQAHVTYLASPSSDQTFWAEQRDGKNALLVGDDDGNNSTQVASLSDYTTYGWFTDNYLLVEKGGSELYIMPAAGGQALKISDYYKPPVNYYGYGGGYGGL